MDDSKKNALNLLIETYKLYAAFCAIFIAGLLSFASTLTVVNCLSIFYVSVIALSLCSLICVFGLQYFISKAYNDNCDIYSKPAKIIIILVMSFLFIGIISGFFFIANQDKMKLFDNSNKNKQFTTTKKANPKPKTAAVNDTSHSKPSGKSQKPN